MVSEFPSNSEGAKKAAPKTAKQDKPERLEKVVTGEVTQRKKPLGKRFSETFMGGDARGVGSYVMFDVLIPAAKDAVADGVSQGIERMLFGEVRSSSRRGRTAGAVRDALGNVDYRGVSSRGGGRREEPRAGRRTREAPPIDEIILETRVEGEEVLNRLEDQIRRYDMATVSDLWDLLGVTGEYTDEKWGWTDIRDARVTRARGGAYILDMPRPEPIN